MFTDQRAQPPLQDQQPSSNSKNSTHFKALKDSRDRGRAKNPAISSLPAWMHWMLITLWFQFPFQTLQSNAFPSGVSLITANNVDSMSPAPAKTRLTAGFKAGICKSNKHVITVLFPLLGWFTLGRLSNLNPSYFIRCLKHGVIKVLITKSLVFLLNSSTQGTW